jgi:hypothetical protein
MEAFSPSRFFFCGSVGLACEEIGLFSPARHANGWQSRCTVEMWRDVPMSRVDSQALLAGLVIGGAVGAVAALLYAPAEGAALKAWRERPAPALDSDPRVDDEAEQSFPASDPPSWTSATTGPAER